MIRLILLIPLLVACRTTECWVETQSDPIVYHDTLTLESIHYHYEDLTGAPHCAWIDEHKIPYTDTVKAVLLDWKRTRQCNCSN